MDAEHAEVRNSEGASRQLIWLQSVLAGTPCDILDLSSDLLETLKVSVLDHGGHQSVVCLHGNAHVDILELSDEVVHPA